jgi:UDP-glucose 4-epimerase
MRDHSFRVVVTGAAGFLGFHLSRALAARTDIEVFCVDNFARGTADASWLALTAKPNVHAIQMDLSDPANYKSLPQSIDYVYHMAALNGTQNFYERPMDVIRSCTLPTMFLADHFKGQDKLKRFVYAGTSEAYASTVTRFGWMVPTGEDVPLSIDDIFNPRWSYAASKMHGEIVCAQAARQFGYETTIIRYHNAYGPRMGDKHVVPDFFERMKRGEYVLHGFADTRSFIYVDDAVRATMLLAETAAAAGEIVNVGSADEMTIHDLGRAMMATRGVEAPIELLPSPQGSVRRRAPSIDKLIRLTNFEAKISLEEGLAVTADYYLDGKMCGPLKPDAHLGV